MAARACLKSLADEPVPRRDIHTLIVPFWP